MTKSDRIVGCIVGGAIGDAMGAAYEGRAPPIHVDNSLDWFLTDDTRLTLATCEGLLRGDVDPASIADKYASWFRAGRIVGIGASTLKALSELAMGGHWALVGRKGEMAAGNGAAMRSAPLAFRLDPSDPKARQTIRDVSRITHHHDEAYAGALAVVVAVRAAWEERWTGGPQLMPQVIDALPDTGVRDRFIEIDTIEADLSLFEIAERFGASGYVVESVPLAVCGAQRILTLGFERLLAELIAGGGDTDTIASIAGQIAGTLIGREGLPEAMLARLPERDPIVAAAVRFAEAVTG